MVLYGPLDDVEDQENQRFPFQPFWVAPFAPTSAIFLTAILEQDRVPPSTTRQAAAGALQGAVAMNAGDSPEQIVPKALSAIKAAVEPLVADVLVNRLIGPPAQLQFSPSQVAEATFGGIPKQTLRFSHYGDYSVNFLMRRN